MAHTRRDQKHLGIDTNVLVAYVDRDHPAHPNTRWLAEAAVALNPTVIHEAYHTLVFKMRWPAAEAARLLTEAATDDNNLFISQTWRTTATGLRLAIEYRLGGRDALILASYLAANVGELLTYDEDLLALGAVRYRRAILKLRRPHRA